MRRIAAAAALTVTAFAAACSSSSGGSDWLTFERAVGHDMVHIATSQAIGTDQTLGPKLARDATAAAAHPPPREAGEYQRGMRALAWAGRQAASGHASPDTLTGELLAGQTLVGLATRANGVHNWSP